MKWYKKRQLSTEETSKGKSTENNFDFQNKASIQKTHSSQQSHFQDLTKKWYQEEGKKKKNLQKAIIKPRNN